MPQSATLLFAAILFFTGFFYVRLIIHYITGWKNIQSSGSPPSGYQPPVSVIVPFRDEGKNLAALIRALQNQDYPENKIEFIFIDDHSSDESVAVIMQFSTSDTRIRILKNNGRGKKDALSTGIQHAAYDIILQTDADAVPSGQWTRTMVRYMADREVIFVSGPVIMDPGQHFFHHLQSLEHLSLTAAGTGSSGIGKPVLCSGANLCYRKSVVYILPDPFKRKVPGGDDVFLLHQLKKRDRSSIRFCPLTTALVYIHPVSQPLDFFSQRGRWTGKSIYFRDRETLFQAISVFLMNMAIVATFLLGFFIHFWWYGTLCLFVMKSIPDYIILHKITGIFGQRTLMKIFIPAQLLYPWYIMGALVSGFFNIIPFMVNASRKVHWK